MLYVFNCRELLLMLSIPIKIVLHYSFEKIGKFFIFYLKKKNKTNNCWMHKNCYLCYIEDHCHFTHNKYTENKSYLTSWSDLASIQYTLDFRLDPKAIKCDTQLPSGNGGLLGICPVQCAIANISGASFTRILPAGDARPASCETEIYIKTQYKC